MKYDEEKVINVRFDDRCSLIFLTFYEPVGNICIMSCRGCHKEYRSTFGRNEMLIGWLVPGQYILTVSSKCMNNKFCISLAPRSYVKLNIY